MMQLVTIVPPTSTDAGHTLVQGTKVLMPSGEAVQGVTKVVLVAEAGGIWSAEIHCHVRVGELKGVLAHFKETVGLDITKADYDAKRHMKWAPEPPMPPPCRIEHRGVLSAFIGPEDEFYRWRAEPAWRRVLGLTAWDRKQARH